MNTTLRNALWALALLAAAPLSAQSLAPRLQAGHAAETARWQAMDPLAKVYILISRDTYERGAKAVVSKPQLQRNKLGDWVVLAEMKAYQIEELSRHIHAQEHRCGGYFAFDSRAEAERFLRDDRSAIAMHKSFVAYTLDSQATVVPWMSYVVETNIRWTISALSAYPNRYYASSHGRNAALAIRDLWVSMAGRRNDVSAELFTACSNCSNQPSVILTIRGNELADEIVVLGGHLDSISNSGSGEAMNAPGADDDASGIATLTEILRVAMATDYKPKRTIQFMAYAAEEVGLRGSKAIAQSYQAQGKNVVGVLQLDMTNWDSPGGSDIGLITDFSNTPLLQFVQTLFATYLAPSGYTMALSACGYACSDHASWTASGYPSAMPDEGPIFPNLHTTQDRLENMGGNAHHSTILAKLGLAFLAEVGKSSTAVGSPPGAIKIRSNQADYAIADNATVDSPITVYRRPGNASAVTPVNVRILHAARGELRVELVAPDGSVYVLADRTGGTIDNIIETYNVNLSSEAANGTWLLRINDNATGNTGILDGWSLTM